MSTPATANITRCVPLATGNDKMTEYPRSSLGRDLKVGAGLSLAAHAVVIAVLVVMFAIDETAEEDEEPESMEVMLEEDDPPVPEAVDEVPDELSDLVPPDDVVPDDVRQEETPEEEHEEDAEEEEEEQEEDEDETDDEVPDDELLDRFAVEQQTDDVEPDDAEHVSDEAHRTDEETVADTTTLEDVEPEDDPEAEEQEADTDRELAMDTPRELEEPDLVDPTDIADADEPEEADEDEELDDAEVDEEFDEEIDDAEPDEVADDDTAPEEPREYRDPEEMFAEPTEEPEAPERIEESDPDALFGRDADRAEEMFDSDELDRRAEARRQERRGGGRQLLSNWRENEEAMRASLENFLPHVEPGNHTSVNAQAADHASYIARMHRTIHANWGNGFLPRLSNNFSNTHPLNDMSLKTVVEIVIDADDGEVVETGRVEPSGNEMFDAEALNVSRNIGDQPDPPDSIVSPDGNVYIHWTYWRDERQCGTFGVSIYRLQDDDERRSVGGG